MGDSWSPRCAYTGSPNHDLGAMDPWSPVSVDPWLSINNSQCSSPIHTQCILSCTAGGKQAARGREGARENRRWEGRREQGSGGREEAMM